MHIPHCHAQWKTRMSPKRTHMWMWTTQTERGPKLSRFGDLRGSLTSAEMLCLIETLCSVTWGQRPR